MAIKDLMRGISTVFEIAGVACILIGFVISLVHASVRLRTKGRGEAYSALRRTFGHSILLGLEILIAADLIRTVAVEPSLENLAVLGALVVIRTFLAWTLEVEIDGRWPWQRCRDEE